MKMFIWDNPVLIKYGGSVIVAVAETIEEAREVATTQAQSSFVGLGIGRYPDKKEDYSRFIQGEPSRVVDVPCVEVFYYQE
jgi:hypothetical protein